MTIDIESLQSFVMAAREGSFSAAARKMGRAQSVVSTHIANAENELGYALFHRGHKPKLTAEGEKLLPFAQNVMTEYARFADRAQTLFSDAPLNLHIGLDHSLGSNVIMDLLAHLSDDYPMLKVQVESLNSFDVNWFFKHSRMALAVVFSNATHFDCLAYEIARIPVTVVAGKKHPLSKKSSVRLPTLKRHRQLVVTARDPESPAPLILSDDPWEVNSGSWALSLAARNVGWAILPTRQLALNPEAAANVKALKVEGLTLAPERLMLLVNEGQADERLTQWWLQALCAIAPLFEHSTRDTKPFNSKD